MFAPTPCFRRRSGDLSSGRRLRKFGGAQILISARRRLGPFSIQPDNRGLRVEKDLTPQQTRLLDILIPGTQELESAALRQYIMRFSGLSTTTPITFPRT